jgi:hypothetical protein
MPCEPRGSGRERPQFSTFIDVFGGQMSQVGPWIALRKHRQVVNNKPGEHLFRLRPLLIVEAAYLSIVEVDLAEDGLRGFDEPESLAGSGTHHPIGELTPFGLRR